MRTVSVRKQNVRKSNALSIFGTFKKKERVVALPCCSFWVEKWLIITFKIESRPTDDTKVYYIVLLLPQVLSLIFIFLVFPFPIEYYAALNNEASLPHPVCLFTSLWRFPGLPLWCIEGCVLYIVPSCASVFRIRLEIFHSIFSFLPKMSKKDFSLVIRRKNKTNKKLAWEMVINKCKHCTASIWSAT